MTRGSPALALLLLLVSGCGEPAGRPETEPSGPALATYADCAFISRTTGGPVECDNPTYLPIPGHPGPPWICTHHGASQIAYAAPLSLTTWFNPQTGEAALSYTFSNASMGLHAGFSLVEQQPTFGLSAPVAEGFVVLPTLAQDLPDPSRIRYILLHANVTATGRLAGSEHQMRWSPVPGADPEPVHVFSFPQERYHFFEQQNAPFLGWTSRLGFMLAGSDFHLNVATYYLANGETGDFSPTRPDGSCLDRLPLAVGPR